MPACHSTMPLALSVSIKWIPSNGIKLLIILQMSIESLVVVEFHLVGKSARTHIYIHRGRGKLLNLFGKCGKKSIYSFTKNGCPNEYVHKSPVFFAPSKIAREKRPEIQNQVKKCKSSGFAPMSVNSHSELAKEQQIKTQLLHNCIIRCSLVLQNKSNKNTPVKQIYWLSTSLLAVCVCVSVHEMEGVRGCIEWIYLSYFMILYRSFVVTLSDTFFWLFLFFVHMMRLELPRQQHTIFGDPYSAKQLFCIRISV